MVAVKDHNATSSQEYYTLKTSPAIKEIKQWEKENPREAEQLRLELELEMRGYYENCHPAQG